MQSRMYDVDVTGYENRTNKLHLFDIESVDEDIVKEGISFDKTDIKKNRRSFYTRMTVMMTDVSCVCISSILW